MVDAITLGAFGTALGFLNLAITAYKVVEDRPGVAFKISRLIPVSFVSSQERGKESGPRGFLLGVKLTCKRRPIVVSDVGLGWDGGFVHPKLLDDGRLPASLSDGQTLDVTFPVRGIKAFTDNHPDLGPPDFVYATTGNGTLRRRLSSGERSFLLGKPYRHPLLYRVISSVDQRPSTRRRQKAWLNYLKDQVAPAQPSNSGES